MEAIKTLGLTKEYGDCKAVDGLDLTVRRGELYSLLGVNGAGKTTAIKLLCCLAAPTAGDAWLDGASVRKEAGREKESIALSPQETAVAPNLTVGENLRLMCGMYGLKGKEAQKRSEELCARLGLDPVGKKRAGKLSGGWQRRLSIAMALIGKPEILFLDEPTLGLDVIARSELWEVIRALKGRVTIVLTTHYMEEAEALSNRIGIMKEGKLLVEGTAEELKKRAGKERFEDAFVAIVRGEAK